MMRGGCLPHPLRIRLQVLPLAPSALRVAPGAIPPSCRGRTRCSSLPPSLHLDLNHPPRSRLPPRCRLPLFGNKGQLLWGRGRGRGYVLPGDISSGQYEAVGGEHSHAVTKVVNAGYYMVAGLCFLLRFIVSLCSVNDWLEERPHLPGGGGGANRTTSHMGTCPQGLLWLRCG